MEISIKAIYPHFRDRSFAMVAESQQNGQYVLFVHDMGMPSHIVTTEGLITVFHKHLGYGSYTLQVSAESVGSNDFTLDPICRALIEKGWSQDLVRMHLWKPSGPRNQITHHILRRDLSLIKPEWDDSQENYLIAPESIYSGGLGNCPDWLINSDLNDNGHISIHVMVPQIYQNPSHLDMLLNAIKSMPDVDEMENVHPAMCAVG